MRARVLVLTALYALSFAVVCLGTCFADTKLDHSCCMGDEGFSAVSIDCCSVVPGHAEPLSVLAAPAVLPVEAPAQAVVVPSASPALTVPVLSASASPPQVLRI